MRKDSISRLLLSFLTAFVLIAGVFAAASLNNAINWEEERASDAIAASEPDIGKGDVGEAPTSANGRDNTEELPSNIPPKDTTSTNLLDSGVEPLKVTPPVQSGSNVEEPAREPHGTRIEPGAYVDANGPYGTPSNPLLEGEDAFFQAQIYGDDQANYDFRWDIDDDGEFETDWSSDPTYFHMFGDDHIGVARVQAWDGTQDIVTYTSNGLSDILPPTNAYRLYATSTPHFANEVTPNTDITITHIGYYKGDVLGLGTFPGHAANIMVWDVASRTKLREVVNPMPDPVDDYLYYPITPLDVAAGTTLRVSIYCDGIAYAGYEWVPTIAHQTASSDGVLDFGNVYGDIYGPGDYPDYYNLGTGYTMCVDIQYDYDVIDNIYLEDTAPVYVENVAPFVSDLTTIPSGGALEGTPTEFSAMFLDPGVDDEWVFRYNFGDGTITDWMKIPKYRFDFPVNNILYYYDGPSGRDFAGQALDEVGFDYTQVNSYSALENELESQTWDLVVVQNPYNYMYDSTFTALNDHVEAGGKLIINTWLTSYYPTNDLWDNLGAWYGGEYYLSSPPIYEWDLTHEIFNSPNDVPNLRGTDIFTYRCGQYLQEIPGVGHPVGGYTPTDTASWYEAGVIAREDKQTVWNAFTPCNYNSDSDGDGTVDVLELLVNEIVWILGGVIQQPFPEPMPLPPFYHVYVDDHPNTLTEMDTFDVTVEVMDDDHAPDGTPATPKLADYIETQQTPEQTWFEEPGGGYGDGLNIGDDQATEEDIGFDFYYYGQEFDSIYICSNGFMDFNTEHIEYWLTGIPQGGAFDNTLYPMWSDLNPYYRGDVYTMTIDDPANPGFKIFVVTYDDIPHYYYYGTHNVQVWLRQADFTIHFNYKQMNPVYSYTYSIGIEGPTTGWFVRSHVGSYPPSYMTRVYTPSEYNPALPPVFGLGSDSTTVTVFNVRPTVQMPAEFIDIVKENGVVNFGALNVDGKPQWGFTIEDPALKVETETFWYRIDYDDGTVTDWAVTNQLMPGEEGSNAGNVMVTGVPFDFPLQNNYILPQQLFYNWMIFCLPDGEGTMLCSDTSWYMGPATPDNMERNLNNNFGTNYDFIYASGWEDLVDDRTGAPLYDMLYFSYDWWYSGFVWYDADEILEYVEAGGHVFLPGDEFGAGVVDFMPWYLEFPSVAYSDFYLDFPGPAFTGSVEDIITAGVATGSWGFSYALHNDIDGYDENEWLPLYADPDPITTLIRPGGGLKYPKNLIVPETHVYGDNGRYDVDIQVIDDDMLWDLSGEQPVFTGMGDPMDWISHNVFEVNIENTDPVLSEVSAYAEVDLSLRMSGEKKNSAVMRLYENGELLAGVTVDRDPGAPDIGVMSATIQMTKGYEYELTVEYLAEDGDGANPTWIFEAHWPDGKIKQLKHTFNSNDPDDREWNLGSVKRMMLGHDIIFQATASDGGSDDLAYIWNFGDCTPHGIHLYPNSLYTPAIQPSPVNGVSDESVALFAQLGGQRDPYFEYDANSERSPESNPIPRLTDSITHIFDENQPYYYYVTLIVMDDDVEEPYVSTQLNPVSGTDMYYLEIDFS